MCAYVLTLPVDGSVSSFCVRRHVCGILERSVLGVAVGGNWGRSDLPLVVDRLGAGRLQWFWSVGLWWDAQHTVHVDSGQTGIRWLIVGEWTLWKKATEYFRGKFRDLSIVVCVSPSRKCGGHLQMTR